jgi:hypothetical protein
MTEARQPFHFMGCWELREMLGRRANDEQELLDALDEVPVDSIYFHTHGYFLRHKYIAGPYPNDFATWAAIQVRDRVLGEKLAVLDPFELADLEAVRAELISLTDDHLANLRSVPRIVFGEPFEFMQSRVLEVPTGVKTRTLAEFRAALATVDASAIYYHVVEARMHKGRRRGDFGVWIDEQLHLPALAERVVRLNPYGQSLEGLRARLVALCDAAAADVREHP